MIMYMPNTFQLGFVGIFRSSVEIFSRIAIGLPSLTFTFLKEIQHLRKGKMITSTLLVMMFVNATNVVEIMFSLTVLNSNRPIPVAMVDVEDMVVLVMAMVE